MCRDSKQRIKLFFCLSLLRPPSSAPPFLFFFPFSLDQVASLYTNLLPVTCSVYPFCAPLLPLLLLLSIFSLSLFSVLFIFCFFLCFFYYRHCALPFLSLYFFSTITIKPSLSSSFLPLFLPSPPLLFLSPRF